MKLTFNEQETAKARALQGLLILAARYDIPVSAIRIAWDKGTIELDHEFVDEQTRVQFAIEAGEIMESV